MGAWGDGIYDNDSALDVLADLVVIAPDERDAARLAAGIGLYAWLLPVKLTGSGGGPLRFRIAELGEAITRLPADTQAALQALFADPDRATEHGARTPAAEAAIGGYSDGPRIDALLRFPGAAPVVAELATRAVAYLDALLSADNRLDEIMGGMSALGVLIELGQAGLWRPASGQVDAWRAGFDAVDRRTSEQRGYWWRYARRVRRGFDVLAPAPPGPARPKAQRRRPAPTAAATGPVERYAHAKFGVGVLLGRVGVGDAEALELRFGDGSVRKILARFLTVVDA
jgi:hypothetical protein